MRSIISCSITRVRVLVVVLFGVTGAQAEDFRDKVLFMRHALAPGTGDPKHFLLGDCNTRRNLSASGREQARNIGRRLKSRGIRFSKIDTNQWCRCRETGGLRGFGKYHEFIGLHSFYEDHFNQDHMLSLLRAKLSEVSTYEDPVLMATHFVTIFGITGETVGSGDMMLFDPVTGISKIFHL